MQEYKDELKHYEKDVKDEKNQKALLEKSGDFYLVYFNLDPPPQRSYSDNGKAVTMKIVQEAIKAGTATIELLDTAIAGIKQREERAKEIDGDKVQKSVHKQFHEKACDLSTIISLTEEDLVAARLVVYRSLDYTSRQIAGDII